MFIRLTHLRNQTGDTIVEVLIAIAIVSLVLAGAYASTNHNIATTQDTQEHGQALQLVQSQVEFLRAANGITAPNDCFSNSGAEQNDNGNLDSTNPCYVDSSGVPTSNQPAYRLNISSSSSDCSSGVYAVSAKWDSVNNTGQAKVSVCYGL